MNKISFPWNDVVKRANVYFQGVMGTETGRGAKTYGRMPKKMERKLGKCDEYLQICFFSFAIEFFLYYFL